MHTRIGLTVAALVGASACGAPDEATEARADRDGGEDAEATPRTQSFYVELDPATTAESAIPQISRPGGSSSPLRAPTDRAP